MPVGALYCSQVVGALFREGYVHIPDDKGPKLPSTLLEDGGVWHKPKRSPRLLIYLFPGLACIHRLPNISFLLALYSRVADFSWQIFRYISLSLARKLMEYTFILMFPKFCSIKVICGQCKNLCLKQISLLKGLWGTLFVG